jgi:nucleotide-binding universal stress UspA family protein
MEAKPMLRTMLIGLDGSRYSDVATELGLKWAMRFGALLAATGVVDEPEIKGPEAVPLGGEGSKERRDVARLADANRRVDEFLERFKSLCGERGVKHRVLADVGVPYREILIEAQSHDLILLGKQSHFRFETQESPDETLTRVLKSAPRPVVVAPECLRDGNGILVAYDGSIQAARSLQALVACGLHGLGDVCVLSIDAASAEVATDRARRAVEYLGAHDIAATPRTIVTQEAVAKVVLAEAERQRVELLVMGAYGRPAVWEFFLGSVTSWVLKHTSVPLFLSH